MVDGGVFTVSIGLTLILYIIVRDIVIPQYNKRTGNGAEGKLNELVRMHDKLTFLIKTLDEHFREQRDELRKHNELLTELILKMGARL